MNKPQLTIHACSWSDGKEALQRIRQQVFIDEQGVSPTDEWDQQDALCTHFLATSHQSEQPIACARLLDDGHIGRVAVTCECRGQGIGQQLIRYILDYAADTGHKIVELDAQTHAIGFYEQLGFHAEGEEFIDAGLPHRRMQLQLPDPHQAVEFSAPPGSFSIKREQEPEHYQTRHQPHFEIPPGGAQQLIEQLEPLTELLIEQLDQSARRCWIYSEDLDHRLFEQPALVDALSRFVRRNANTELKILLTQSRTISQRGHALLRLRHRLPSLIEIREADPDAALNFTGLLLFDQSSWLELHALAPVEASLYQNCPVQQRDLAEQFINAWEVAIEPAELRSLKL